MWQLSKKTMQLYTSFFMANNKLSNQYLLSFNKKFVLLCLSLVFTLCIFAKQDTSCVNPVFRDSILKNKVDTAKWNVIKSSIDINKSTHKNREIQKEKHPLNNISFLYISCIILLVLLLMRLIFDDFSFSLLEGIFSFKKYLLYYQSKKYDSLIAIILVYLISATILSLITYIVLVHFVNDDFTNFDILLFLEVLAVVILFFSAKYFIEFIFNWVIDTQNIFRAFFLQNLFSELLLSIVALFLLLIYIYNSAVSYNFTIIAMSFIVVVYLVFNTLRSYQLMDSVRIPYKLHFFLYICAFKIIPMLLIAKYILNNVVA